MFARRSLSAVSAVARGAVTRRAMAAVRRAPLTRSVAPWARQRAFTSRARTTASTSALGMAGMIATGCALGVAGATGSAVFADGETAAEEERFQLPLGVEGVKYRYELRIRQMSSPEKVFEYFASTKDEKGNPMMTFSDFVLAITPVYVQHGRQQKLSKEAMELLESVDSDGDGKIAYWEYLFFVTLLSIPEKDFRVAFKMFDTNGDGTVDADEFDAVMTVMRDRTAVGQHSRGARSFTDTTEPEAFSRVCRSVHAFFGEDGTGTVTFEVFSSFLSKLRSAVARLEFEMYDVQGSGWIYGDALAMSIACYARSKDVKKLVERIDGMSPQLRNTRIPYADFVQFHLFLNHIDEVAVAISTYGAATGAIGAEDFVHAANAVAGVALPRSFVDLLIFIFDDNQDGTLDADELSAILEKKATRGLNRPRTIGFVQRLQRAFAVLFE